MTRIALVTGASRGIGAATARLLATKGYAVCVNFRTESAFADQVVADIEAAGGRALAVQADVALAEDVARLFETVDTSLGVLDLLVNNAAIMSPRQRVDQIPIEEIERVLQVNVIGLIACAQQGNPNRGVPYAVSKGAVNSFSTGLSQEVAAEGIRVNTVSPGPIRTDMPGEEALARAAQVVPMGRAGEPEEIAEAIAWLASDEAGFVAGANLRVAGGRI